MTDINLDGYLRVEIRVDVYGDTLYVVVPYLDPELAHKAISIAHDTALLRLAERGL